MQHPTPPPAEPLPEQPQFSLSPERRSQINDDLKLPEVGLAVAVNHPPGNRRAHLTIVKLPRGRSGRAPRRGVHIPLPAHAQKGLGRVSRHARQQHREGKFGNKGKATIERKLEMLNASGTAALVLAVKHTLRRASAYLGFEKRGEKLRASFVAAYNRARAVVGHDRLQAEVRA